MANHLNLEEQEQLDQFKQFWAQYGNLITWVLIAVFGSIAAWNGWNFWQRSQSTKAAALYDAIDSAVAAKDTDRIGQALTEIQDRFGGTAFAAQGALLASKALFDAGKLDTARSALVWVSDKAPDDGYQAVARLRLAALDLEAKAYDQALKALEGKMPKAFEPLAADRRGDIFLVQGKADEAKAQYEAAWRGFGDRVEYRKLVEIKLASLGVDAATLVPAVEVAR